MLRALIRTAGVMLLCGCNAAFDYPESKAESTPARCTNATDDDFDGDIDCDDPDCDGFCLEQDTRRCADGRDNDGDGLTDGLDPRCWSLAGPASVRCVTTGPVDFEERFDGVLSDTRWLQLGEGVVELSASTDRPDRLDKTLAVLATEHSESVGLTSRVLFDGNWQAFDLGFQALVGGGAGLRVALVPAALTSEDGSPLEDAMDEALGVDLRPDGAVVLLVDGIDHRAGSFVRGSWQDVRLRKRGPSLEVVVGGKRQLALDIGGRPASRLVILADPVDGGSSRIDDLFVRLAGKAPCGVRTPQIPLCSACELDESLYGRNVGWSVSVARSTTGAYCALTADGEAGLPYATGARSWRSATARQWEPGGELVAGAEGEAWVGVSVAGDFDGGFLAAVETETLEGPALHLLASPDCVEWTATGVLALPAGAHSPSYLVPGVTSPLEIYFALDSVGEHGPSLWRFRSEDGQTFHSEEAPVSVLPADPSLAPPYSIRRAGPRDVVLIHRISPEEGELGLGLWVAADDALTTWLKSSTHPIVEPAISRHGADGQGMVSGTLFWDETGGFLLYGGLGSPLWELHRSERTDLLTVSAAALVPAGHDSTVPPFTPPTASPSVPGGCGDGVCDEVESCSTCSGDCGVCEGELLLFDTFQDAAPWQGTDSADPSVYVSSLAERVNLRPGAPSWLTRSLPSPLVGDFELSFDAQWVLPQGASEEDRCTALVGVASGAAGTSVTEGVFAQLDQQLVCEPQRPAFSAIARVGSSRYAALSVDTPKRQCQQRLLGYREAWHHVVLRRRGGDVSVAISAASQCAQDEEATASYAGPLGTLDRLAVGWGPTAWTDGCSIASAGLSIDNISLRSLPCSEQSVVCPDAETGEDVCVDVTSTPEHCGACNAALEEGERCVDGEASCAGEICPVGDAGVVVCTDTETSGKHCGACGRAVGALEVCQRGRPVAVMVPLPDGNAIDATEVTNEQYEAWLSSDPLIANQPEECGWNDSFTPGCGWQPGEMPDTPVTCVDWCDARAYCADVGKRLCETKTWGKACSGEAGNSYPYGDEYDPLACNGVDNKLASSQMLCAPLTPVASLAQCQSSEVGYEGVFDLSGNAGEWLDVCAGASGAFDACFTAGGSTCSPEDALACARTSTRSRNTTTTEVGIRCCSL